MLRDLSLLVSPVLALLLVVLTPVGTGSGAHRDQQFDPLFPHVHLGAPPPSPTVPGLTPRTPGLSLGAGSGAASFVLSSGLTPTTPLAAMRLPHTDASWSWHVTHQQPPGRIADPPPDPPPPLDRTDA